MAIIPVNSGDDLQAAINAAVAGDILQLQASTTFTGNFTLPVHSGGAIIIRSAGSLPASGVRVTPATAAAFAKIQPSPGGSPGFATDPAAHDWSLIGLELLPTPTGDGNILNLGDGSSAQNSLAQVPYNLVVDRCYIHGDATYGQKRGISLQSGTTTIENCYISDIKFTGQDTQAIAGWNGPGPWTIDNNYLEATTENFLVGGANIQIPGLIPTGITFTNNDVTKPLAWRGAGYNIKNLLELKTGINVLINGNTFTNNWGGEGQSGYALVFTVRNEEGSNNWATIQNVTCTNNTIAHSGSLMNILGLDDRPGIISVLMNNLVFQDNLAYDINGGTWNGAGHFAQIHSGNAITLNHNTVLNSGGVSIYFVDAPNTNFTLTNNIFDDNGLAIFDTNGNLGTAALNAFASPYTATFNVLIAGHSTGYPAGNFYPATEGDVGFTDVATNDYRLTIASPYHNAASDGSDIGVRFGAPPPPPPPPPTLPGAPTTPSPANGAVNVAIETALTWVTGGDTDTYTVAFGFTISPPVVSVAQIGTSYTPPANLINDRVYYWRITANNADGSTASALWNFTTIAAAPIPSPIYHLRDVVRRRLRRSPIVWSEKKGIQSRVRVNLFSVDMQPGVGTRESPDPVVMVRASRDGGRTWGDERQMSAGRVGRYVKRLNAWQWGQGRQWVFEISCTDAVLWNLVGAYLDAEGGQS